MIHILVWLLRNFYNLFFVLFVDFTSFWNIPNEYVTKVLSSAKLVHEQSVIIDSSRKINVLIIIDYDIEETKLQSLKIFACRLLPDWVLLIININYGCLSLSYRKTWTLDSAVTNMGRYMLQMLLHCVEHSCKPSRHKMHLKFITIKRFTT